MSGEVEVNGLSLTTGQLRQLLYREFWKQTLDADLNTVGGCEQAATVAAGLIAALDPSWQISSHEMPPWEPRTNLRRNV